MSIILPKSVMLLPPRTGSTWACRAMKNAGIQYRQFGSKHSTDLPPNAPAFRFCMTREPAAWVRSRWTLGAWNDDLTPFWDINADKFRASVTDAMVVMYFSKYVALCKPNGFVGTVETAADSLVAALRAAGEEFDETALRETQRLNTSPTHGGLIDEVYWGMKRDALGKLPPSMIGNLPVELIHKLPPGTLESLPPEILVVAMRRITRSALESAGAAARGAR